MSEKRSGRSLSTVPMIVNPEEKRPQNNCPGDDGEPSRPRSERQQPQRRGGRAHHQYTEKHKRSSVPGAELVKTLIVMALMRFPNALAAVQTPAQGDCCIGDERQEHKQRKPRRPD